MALGNVHISGFSAFLPNAPVFNDQIENVLGRVNEISSKLKRRILINNGIRSRHYAIDPVTRIQTHTNAQLTAEAIRLLASNAQFDLHSLECLACGTSSPDQFIPSHGSMVQAELGVPACEMVSTIGVCCAGMSAFKYGYMNVACGNVRNAIVTGSELASLSLTADHFQPELALLRSELGKEPMLPFASDFLRWMLSDGAGALLLTREPGSGPAMRIDWLDILSYAADTEVCMYSGLRKRDDGSTESYRTVADPNRLSRDGYLNLSQDVAVLKDRIPVLMVQAIERIKAKRELSPDRIDWLLPHISSYWFRQPLYDALVRIGLEIPNERWFTNLTTKGNTGSASIYIILEELASSGRLCSSDRILCIVPESARMTFAFLHLTVL
jgi:3-oxoacyl-[acyl-carrier-protein] synthase-3